MIARLIGRILRRGVSKPPELRGRPQIRREKTYAADSGYVYQYFYEGYRDSVGDPTQGREYVFRCTSNRRSHVWVTVSAPAESFAAWERDSGRTLNEVERYAIVKMRLFEIFDESDPIRDDLVDELTEDDVDRQVEVLDL